MFYVLQACYEGGKEVIVVPKTSASSDSPWMGLAKYAWSGYVVLVLVRVVSKSPKVLVLSKLLSAQVCHRMSQLWSDLPKPSVLVREPGSCGHGGPD